MKGSEEGEEDIKRMSRIYERKEEGREMGEMCRGDKRIFRIYKRKDEGERRG